MTHRNAPQFALRFPDEAMRDEIKALADAQGRTMNAQIIHMLQSTGFSYGRDASMLRVEKAIARLERRLK